MQIRQQREDMSKESAILEAATRSFLRKGFSGVSMEEIARESNVAKQTLYGYFKGKDDLFRAIIHAQSDGFFSTLPHNDDQTQNIEEFLYIMGERAMDMLFKRDTLALYRVIVSETPRFPELGKFYWQSGAQAFTDRLSNFLTARGFPKGEAQSATEQFLSFMFGTLLTKTLLNKEYHPSKEEKKAHIEQAVSAFFMLNGQYVTEKVNP